MAVLIVAYRSADKLETCIQSAQRYLPDLGVHVWDNSGPECPDVRRVAAHTPNVHWYLGGENIGFAAAVNRLAAMVPDHDFLLLNPDAELVGPLTLTRAAMHDPETAAAAPMTCEEEFDGGRAGSVSRRHQPWDVAHRRRTVLNALGELGVAAEVVRGTWLSNLYRHQPSDVEGYLTGACLAIRREAWDSLGPFDEEFFLYGEEADWQSRAVAAGWRVRLQNESGVRHFAQGTVAGDAVASTRSSDLVRASIALQLEYRRGARTAEGYIAGAYVVEGVKRTLGRGDRAPLQSDVIVVIDGPLSPSSAELIRQASALAHDGRAVTVVSLRALGALPRDLPPSIRLLRRPWWFPRTWPGDASAVLVAGTAKRERAFARLFRFSRRGSRVDTVEAFDSPIDSSRKVTVPTYDLESI